MPPDAKDGPSSRRSSALSEKQPSAPLAGADAGDSGALSHLFDKSVMRYTLTWPAPPHVCPASPAQGTSQAPAAPAGAGPGRDAEHEQAPPDCRAKNLYAGRALSSTEVAMQ